MIIILLIYQLYQRGLLLILPCSLLLIFISELVLELNSKWKGKYTDKIKYIELVYYSLFALSYYYAPGSLLAVLIFLYGLPTGTLLVKKLL